jgi:DNA-binding transcriptional ArsR family regulator
MRADDKRQITPLIKNVESRTGENSTMDEADWSSLHKILSDSTRRSILELLAEKESLSYTEIMTLLRVTNTGRLNYHLKALGGLVSKEEEGRYRLTERGRLAVNLLRTFPERPPAEKKRSLKSAVAIVLILFGALLIFSGLLFVALAPGTASASSNVQASLQTQIIPQNTTVSLMPWNVPAGVSQLDIAWSASGPLNVYVLNTTQYDALLLQHDTGTQAQVALQNFSGMPASWVSQYDLQNGNVSLSLPQGQFYFLAGSSTPTVLDSFGLTQAQQQVSGSSSPFLLASPPALFLIALGALAIVLGVSILGRRVWR